MRKRNVNCASRKFWENFTATKIEREYFCNLWKLLVIFSVIYCDASHSSMKVSKFEFKSLKTVSAASFPGGTEVIKIWHRLKSRIINNCVVRFGAFSFVHKFRTRLFFQFINYWNCIILSYCKLWCFYGNCIITFYGLIFVLWCSEKVRRIDSQNRRTTTKSFNKKWTKLINEIFKAFFLGWFLMVLPFTFGFQHPKSFRTLVYWFDSLRKQAEVWWHLNSGKYLTEVFPANPRRIHLLPRSNGWISAAIN